MVDLRVCIIIAREHPETIEFAVSYDAAESDKAKITTVEDAKAEKVTLDGGLDDFQLIPRDASGNPKLSGEELLNHMCRWRNVKHAKDAEPGEGVRVEPTVGLNVELYEDSLECIQPSEGELRRGAILRDSFGNRAARKCAKRKLNNLGAIVGQATVVNSMENMEKMRDNLQFASAMAQISH